MVFLHGQTNQRIRTPPRNSSRVKPSKIRFKHHLHSTITTKPQHHPTSFQHSHRKQHMNKPLFNTADIENITAQLTENYKANDQFNHLVTNHIKTHFLNIELEINFSSQQLVLTQHEHQWHITNHKENTYLNNEQLHQRETKLLNKIFGETKQTKKATQNEINTIHQLLPPLIQATKVETLTWVIATGTYLTNYYTNTDAQHHETLHMLRQAKYGEDPLYINLIQQQQYLTQQQYQQLTH